MKKGHDKEYVILEMLETKHQLYIVNEFGKDHTINDSGKKIYRIIGYADSTDEIYSKITRRKC